MSTLSSRIRLAAKPLPPISHPSFASTFDSLDFHNARIVCIGDASHGTSEFYSARAELTKHLIDNHGYTIVAVEADWPDAAAINRFAHGLEDGKRSTGRVFTRFPVWMWRNREVDGFVNWMREWNKGKSQGQQAGFYGMDLYSLNESIKVVIKFLEEVDPEAAKAARKKYGCLRPWRSDPHEYGADALRRGYGKCEESVISILSDLLEKRYEYYDADAPGFIDAEYNARLIKDAEEYYRASFTSDESSWNFRDRHMFDTLSRIIKSKPGSKAIVWAHNSHLGDARATENSPSELNIGQLCREKFGEENVRLIGCGTHTGTVAAADNWDDPMTIMKVNASRPGSWEEVLHHVGLDSFLLNMRPGEIDEDVRNELMKDKLERFIGVIYRPRSERWSHYQYARLAQQFDAFVWFDRTEAVRILGGEVNAGGGRPVDEETWPFGL